MRVLLTTVLLLALPGAALANEVLLGTWDIEVHGGTAQGDTGQVTIYQQDGRLMADMTFNDSSAAVTATESCIVWAGSPSISISCKVLTPSPMEYAPDNFWVQLVNPDRMEGRMMSLTGGPATLTRRNVPTS